MVIEQSFLELRAMGEVVLNSLPKKDYQVYLGMLEQMAEGLKEGGLPPCEEGFFRSRFDVFCSLLKDGLNKTGRDDEIIARKLYSLEKGVCAYFNQLHQNLERLRAAKVELQKY